MRFLLIIMLIGCGSVKAKTNTEDDEINIQCVFLDAWDFKRCENEEVVCYTNDHGLSCKFKN